MKVFLRSSVVFTAFACTFYVFSILALGLIGVTALNLNFRFLDSPSRTLLRVTDIQRIDSVDVLFLGSSRSFMGFDTRIFNAHGYSAFNFGTAAQTPVQTEVLLNRYLHDIEAKLIIYEVYSEGFESDGLESATDLLASDIIDRHSWKMVTEINEPTSFHSFLFAFASDLTGQERVFSGSKGGYIDRSGYIDREVTHNVALKKHFPPSKLKIRDYQWAAFLRCVSLLRESGTPFILVQAPVPRAKYNSELNRDSLSNLLREQGEFLDFNNLVELDDSLHFEDDSHLNQIGVEIFNRKLLEILEARQHFSQNTSTTE